LLWLVHNGCKHARGDLVLVTRSNASKGGPEIGKEDKIRTNLPRAEAADRLAQLAEQLRNGTISLGEEDEPISVPDEVRLKADLDDDKLEVELKWEEA